jgi:hypothetical protein
MSDTPRTEKMFPSLKDRGDNVCVWISLGEIRELERELNEANADRLRLREALNAHHKWRRKEENQRQAKEGYRESWLHDASKKALSSPPPPVVAKSDADALVEALALVATDESSSLDVMRICIKANETYSQKYKS